MWCVSHHKRPPVRTRRHLPLDSAEDAKSRFRQTTPQTSGTTTHGLGDRTARHWRGPSAVDNPGTVRPRNDEICRQLLPVLRPFCNERHSQRSAPGAAPVLTRATARCTWTEKTWWTLGSTSSPPQTWTSRSDQERRCGGYHCHDPLWPLSPPRRRIRSLTSRTQRSRTDPSGSRSDL